MSDRSTAGRRGTLSMTFAFPPEAFLYRPTKPRLRVDGVDVPVPGWGTHRVPVDPGPHDVRVWVPYALPRRAGKARTEVTVPAGQEVRLEYLAPTVTFRAGSLGKPGEQVSSGHSIIMVANVVAIIVVVVLLLVALLLR